MSCDFLALKNNSLITQTESYFQVALYIQCMEQCVFSED